MDRGECVSDNEVLAENEISEITAQGIALKKRYAY